MWTPEALGALAYLLVAGSLVGFTAYVWLLRAAPVSLVSTYAYVNPIVAVALAWLLLGETITLQMGDRRRRDRRRRGVDPARERSRSRARPRPSAPPRAGVGARPPPSRRPDPAARAAPIG